MSELVSTLNDLLDSVVDAARSKEQFHAAASHELRTPLQALGGHLQVALSRERTGDEYRAALEEASIQTERLTLLVRELLLLNQLQMMTSQPASESVNLAETCDVALSQLDKMIASSNIVIEEELNDTELPLPPIYTAVLLRNLIENAIKYTPEGGHVEVVTKPSPATFTVWNEVANADTMQTDKWFEAFFRPDESRTSTTGGNGLGLAICKAICDANNWTVSIQPENGGIRATVVFEQSP
jgi:two-component system heavy metal sensor histidine kinase CusS